MNRNVIEQGFRCSTGNENAETRFGFRLLNGRSWHIAALRCVNMAYCEGPLLAPERPLNLGENSGFAQIS